MNVYERFALGSHLCEIPENKTYDEVLDMLLNRDAEVLIWQPFERYELEDLAEQIEDMRDALLNTFIPREELLQ